ncbi:Peptide methionine sulfoxide reductase B2, chloroplastic [Coemansia brasiliensis]|uniref:Peptide-methionine (R)-S-oxide reductase n=1 Tax=Coemansia brasiliensis TaxID=2650707 RepID=A0A9W8ICJ8_9FUNG|nr:Peptide methionine sulfoxide reductase B2, chloroplastic [Coemansia brasiliensis]
MSSKTEDEWRAILTPEQFAVLRQKDTEKPGTGEYTRKFDPGVYNCGACGAALYKSSAKFDAHCGWPAFYEAIPGAVRRIEDHSHGMARTEIVCSQCASHLGHVFKGEGFKTPTDERHCVNSISLKFHNDQ